MKKLLLISLVIFFAISSKSWAEKCYTGTIDATAYLGNYYCSDTVNYTNGDKYVGGFFIESYGAKDETGKWQRHGQGKYTWATGNKYVGSWKYDKQHGQGIYTWADGTMWVGEWRNSKQVNGKQYAAGEYKRML